MKLTVLGKISVIVVILFLATLWVFPMWDIQLAAPQYPGGLAMQIWINDLSGDVEIINGLNHYIGMKTIHKEDFKEFVYLPIIMMSFMAVGLVVFFLNRKRYYYLWTVMFVLIGMLSFYDFYSWLYDYGHNLDPKAPIQVPGMSYQPPLIGYKKMLNFEALSQPHVGGWFYIAAGVILASVCFYEWKKSKKESALRTTLFTMLMPVVMSLASCSQGYNAISYGNDGCSHCKMTIVDARFGAELMTDKGKVYKFDDILCLKQYIDEQNLKQEQLMLFVENYNATPNDVIDAKQAIYIQHEYFASPMNGDYAAFTNATDAGPLADSLQARLLSWNDIQ